MLNKSIYATDKLSLNISTSECIEHVSLITWQVRQQSGIDQKERLIVFSKYLVGRSR